MKLRHVLVAVLFWSSLALSLNLSVRADNPISTPANGAVEGCLNQTLFNGYWRARVTKVEQVRRKTTLSPSTGWGVYMEWTNTTTSRSPNPGVWN